MFNKIKQKATEIFGRLFGTKAQQVYRDLGKREVRYFWKSVPADRMLANRWMRRLFRSPGQTYNVGMNAAKRQSDSYAMNNKQKRRNRSALRKGIAAVLTTAHAA
jgi:hypothetical protein